MRESEEKRREMKKVGFDVDKVLIILYYNLDALIQNNV